MTADDESTLRAELARLQQEHRDLDAAIEALNESPGRDQIQVQRLKKRKLILRDRIAFGKPLSQQGVWQERVAQARTEINMCRLLVLYTARKMDVLGNKAARNEISQ